MYDTPEPTELRQLSVMPQEPEEQSGRSTPTPPVESVMATEERSPVPTLARADTTDLPKPTLQSNGSSLRRTSSRKSSRQTMSNAEPYSLGLRRSSSRKNGSISRRSSLRSNLSRGSSAQKSLSKKLSSLMNLADDLGKDVSAVPEVTGVISRSPSLAREVLEELYSFDPVNMTSGDHVTMTSDPDVEQEKVMEEEYVEQMDLEEPCATSEGDPMNPLPPLISPITSVEELDSSTSNDIAVEPEPVPAGPPAMDIVLSFDTTGSMSSVLDEVRGRMQHMIERLFMDIPNLKISVIAHGDYCDATHFYVTQFTDFTNDVHSLCKFVKDVGGTGGGDWEECYELVLKEVREKLSWTSGTRRALVMIGDAVPHDAKYPLNTDNIDWREEVRRLHQEMGVKIYAVQCMNEKHATPFWQELASSSGGRHVKLDKFSDVIHMLMAVCYREHGTEYFEAYEKEVRGEKGLGMTRGLSNVFDALRDGDGPSTSTTTVSLGKPSARTPIVARRKRTGAKKAGKNSKKDATVALKLKKKVTALPTAAKKAARTTAASSKVSKKKMKSPRMSTKKWRENVQETKFELRHQLMVSPWKLVMSKEIPETGKKGWIPRSGGRVGFRKQTLFTDSTRSPALYEFAVQPKPGCKKYVMYFRASNGFTINGHWDTYLLRHKGVRNQIDNVLDQGGLIYVRWFHVPRNKTRNVGGFAIPNLDAVRSYLVKNFDYAWCKRWSGRPQHRIVSRRGMVLSEPIP